MPLRNNDLIVGAVGVLQFEVVAFRLKYEYKVDCVYEPVSIHVARWLMLLIRHSLRFSQKLLKIWPRRWRISDLPRAHPGQS